MIFYHTSRYWGVVTTGDGLKVRAKHGLPVAGEFSFKEKGMGSP
jgi:hypothetical protein